MNVRRCDQHHNEGDVDRMNNIIKEGTSQSGIYRIYNKSNGKFYIGSTSNFRKRMREHLHGLRRNNHVNNYLQHAYNKYGEDSFVFEVFEYVENSEALLSTEQTILDDLRPFDHSVGYNISKNATSYRVYGEEHFAYGVPKSDDHKKKTSEALMGHEVSEETRIKISKSLAGKNMGENHWAYGKVRSEEHIKNHALSLKGKYIGDKNKLFGKKQTLEHRRSTGKPVVKLSKEGDFISIYATGQEAAEDNGMSKAHIGCCCKGRRKTTGGYKWMYLEEYEQLKSAN